jgi:hypothetical protein
MSIIAVIVIVICMFLVVSLFELIPLIQDKKESNARVELLAVQLQNIEDAAVEYLARQRYLHSLIK